MVVGPTLNSGRPTSHVSLSGLDEPFRTDQGVAFVLTGLALIALVVNVRQGAERQALGQHSSTRSPEALMLDRVRKERLKRKRRQRARYAPS